MRWVDHTPKWILPVQFFPSPLYPGLHEQLKDPWVLLQNASELQLCVSATHSSISEISFKLHVNKWMLNRLKNYWNLFILGSKICFSAKASVRPFYCSCTVAFVCYRTAIDFWTDPPFYSLSVWMCLPRYHKSHPNLIFLSFITHNC